MPRIDPIRDAFSQTGTRPRYSINWRDFMIILLPGTILSFAFWSQAPPAPVKPTVPVKRTVKGVKAGTDEILEKAIQVVGA